MVRSYERGESDRVYALYTKEFGFLWARASAVRSESSKMRYALQHYAHVRVSLVRGSGGWRVAGAAALTRIAAENRSGLTTFARIASLVERLVGEERNDYLFQSLHEAALALAQTPRDNHGAIELLCVARVLYALGYVSAEALGTALFTHTAYAESELREAEDARTKLLASVNKALAQTHL